MNEIADLAKALAAAQGEFKNPVKDRVNPHFKNKYATLDALQSETRPILAKHGLAVVQLPTTAPSLITRLMHSSGQFVESETPLPTNLPPQQFGSALTYMRRYSYAAILNITADEDDDAEAGSKAPKPVKQEAAAAAGTTSGRELAQGWVEEMEHKYRACTTMEDVDALTEQANAASFNKKTGAQEKSRVDRLKEKYPDLHSRYLKARLDAEERLTEPTYETEATE